MAEQSAISWTDATFNPWWGCSKVSPACDHCYAERDAKRFSPDKALWGVGAERREFGDKHWNEPLRWAARGFAACSICNWRGEQRAANVRDAPGESMPVCPQCDGPVVKARRRIFCASMADVFDKDAPEGARSRLWSLIAETPELDWLLLTKRIGNAHQMLPPKWQVNGPGHFDPSRWPSNLWLGATVVNQEEADRDIPKLLAVPARVRFLSIEPMLGPIDLERPRPGPDLDQGGGRMICQPWLIQSGIDWIIAGGESGPHARPAHPDWFRSLRDQCASAGVPFHFKQWGEWATIETTPVHPESVRRPGNLCRVQTPGQPDHYVAISANAGRQRFRLERVGKRAAGRLLDGVEHSGFPAEARKAGP